MSSLIQWTWVWVNFGSWWWTGRPVMLQFMGSQRVRQDWATELLNYVGSIPGLERSSREGNGNPLYSLVWRIPWTEEPGKLQSMGSQRVRHDWATSLSLSPGHSRIYISNKVYQFSSVAQSSPTLCDPMDCTLGLPVHHQIPEFTQTHVHRVGDAIQPSHPLSSPSPPASNPSQPQSLFQRVNSSHEVAKLLEFQLQYHSFQRTPRTDL